jgi:hypothetical protein
MEQHDIMFPEKKLTESEKMDILRIAVKTVQEEVAKKCKQLCQVQARRQEEMKDDSALVVSDLKVK